MKIRLPFSPSTRIRFATFVLSGISLIADRAEQGVVRTFVAGADGVYRLAVYLVQFCCLYLLWPVFDRLLWNWSSANTTDSIAREVVARAEWILATGAVHAVGWICAWAIFLWLCARVVRSHVD